MHARPVQRRALQNTAAYATVLGEEYPAASGDSVQPFLVWRILREVSDVNLDLVACRTQAVFDHLRAQ